MPASIAATSARESGLVRSTPDTSPAKQGPTWRMLTVIISLLIFPGACSLSANRFPPRIKSGAGFRRSMRLLLLPAFHRPFELRGRPVGRPHRFVFLALELDQIGRRERVLPGRVE